MENKIFILALVGILILAGGAVFLSNIFPNEGEITGWAIKGSSRSISTCVDSDVSFEFSNGVNSFQAGNVAGFRNGVSYLNNDYCDEDKLNEFYCDGTSSKKEEVICERGCLSGACVEEILYGDINGDGFVDVGDLSALSSYVSAGQVRRDSRFIQAADLDFNGEVNSIDRDILENYLLGIIPSLSKDPNLVYSNKVVPVLEIVYIPTKTNGRKVDTTKTLDWESEDLQKLRDHISKISSDTIRALEEGSAYHGYKDSSSRNYLDYYVYSRKEFLREAPLVGGYGSVPAGDILRADLNKILKDEGFDICDYVDNKGLRELWLYIDSSPLNGVFGAVESFQISPEFTFGNAGYRQGTYPICEGTYTIYGVNFGRGSGESIHNHMHHLERTMDFVDSGFYDGFSGHKKEFEPNNFGDTFLGCGWAHCPSNVITGMCFMEEEEQRSLIEQAKPFGKKSNGQPKTQFDVAREYNEINCLNSQDPNCMCIKDDGQTGNWFDIDYDFCNGLRENNTCICQGYNLFSEREIKTDCENWRPDGSGELTTVSCNTWSETGKGKQPCYNDDLFKNGEVGFYIWWMQNIPGQGNDIEFNGKKMANFWDYIADFDASRKENQGMYKKPSLNCVDLDGGENSELYGVVSLSNGTTYSDYCIVDTNSLTEFTCGIDSKPVSSILSCGAQEVCLNGACSPKVLESSIEPLICTDSDISDNKNLRGIVKLSNSTHEEIYQDICVSDSRLREYSCNGLNGEKYVENDCSSNQECNDGRCIDKIVEVPNIPSVSCIDTDGGKDASVRGVVTRVSGDTTQTFSDVCYGGDRRVREYYCSETDSIAAVFYDCSSSEVCQDGACIPKPINACLADSDCDYLDSSICSGDNLFNNNYYCDAGTCKQGSSSTTSCSDSNECTIDSCSSGGCINYNSPVGTSCASGTGTCNGAGSCVVNTPTVLTCNGVASYMTPPGSVSCSSQISSGNACSFIKDGDINTRWTANGFSNPQPVVFDLGNQRCISGVKIHAYFSDHKTNLEVSNDGLNWRRVSSSWSLNKGGKWNEKTFSETNARYLRIDFYESPYSTVANEVEIRTRDYS